MMPRTSIARSLCLLALMAALLPTLAMAAAATPSEPYTGPIIDSHAHLRLGEGDAMGPGHRIGTDALRALDFEAGIGRSALIVMAASGDMAATRAKNDAAIAAAREHPGHFYPVASVHPFDGDAALAEIDRLAGLGVRQVKLHPNSQEFDVADPRVAAVVARCGERRLAVLMDSYNPMDPGQLGKLLALAMANPGTNFVFAHMGFSQFRETHAFALLRKLGLPRNVWFDLSATLVYFQGSPMQDELLWTMRRIGMDRMLFGSDWPVDAPGTALAAARALPLTADEQRLFFHDNAVALLRLDPVAPVDLHATDEVGEP